MCHALLFISSRINKVINCQEAASTTIQWLIDTVICPEGIATEYK